MTQTSGPAPFDGVRHAGKQRGEASCLALKFVFAALNLINEINVATL